VQQFERQRILRHCVQRCRKLATRTSTNSSAWVAVMARNFRPPDIVLRKPVRFLGLLGGLRPRNASRVEFPETACGFDSGPGREPRELAIDEANRMPPSCGRKKRTGFGSHPGERKPKPDAAGTQVAHGDFSPEARGCERAFRRAIEKADRFWFAPWRAKTQARCGGGVSSASTFRRHVQLLKPEDTATVQKEMAWPTSPHR